MIELEHPPYSPDFIIVSKAKEIPVCRHFDSNAALGSIGSLFQYMKQTPGKEYKKTFYCVLRTFETLY